MSMEKNLETASFKSVTFEIIDIKDSFPRRIVEHQFPNRDGAELEDLGRQPWKQNFSAVFYGDDYETNLSAFISVCNEATSGEFVHPVFGKIESAKININSINHSADEWNYCTVECEGIEDGTSTSIPELFSIGSFEDDLETEVGVLEALESTLTDVISDATDFYNNATNYTKDITKRFNRLSKKIDTAVQLYDDVTDVSNYPVVKALNRVRYSASKLKDRIISSKPKMTEKRLTTTVPAAVVAQLLYGDGSRYAEIIAQNKIRNPFLIPAGTNLIVSQE